MKDCPFCGCHVDFDDPDTLHPSGVFWRDTEHGRLYYGWSECDFEDRENKCYQLNCLGCGCEMHGDSKDEVIEKWEKRVKRVKISTIAHEICQTCKHWESGGVMGYYCSNTSIIPIDSFKVTTECKGFKLNV